MSTSRQATLGEQFLIGWGSLILVVASLYWAKPILVPFILALLLTFILSPLVAGLQHYGLGRVPAALLVVLSVTALLILVGWTFTWQTRALVSELPEHKQTILTKMGELQGPLNELTQLVKEIVAEVQAEPADLATKEGQQHPLPVVIKETSPGFQWLPGVLSAVAEVMATALLVMVLVLFMLIQREALRNRMLRLLRGWRFSSTTQAIGDATRRISRYLVAELCINVGFAIALGVGLLIAGIPYALLWAALAGIFRFIPYLGIWLIAGPVIVFSFAVFPGWTEPAIVLALFVALELLVYYAVEPLFLRQGTGVSPVALLLAATFWAWLWGPVGLILSTPMTVCLIVLGKYIPQLEFLSILLGDEPVLAPWEVYYQRLLARDDDEASELLEEHLRHHDVKNLADDVLLPALRQLKRDAKQHEVEQETRDRIVHVTRDIVDDLLPARADAEQERHAEDKVVVIGCPAADIVDELALSLLARLLDDSQVNFVDLSSKKLAAEVLALVQQKKAVAVVIAAVPPDGLNRMRYFCKRLRCDYPDLPIVAAFWGPTEHREPVVRRLQQAGANAVGFSLQETRTQVLPFTAQASGADQDHRLRPRAERDSVRQLQQQK
jgi:predicted PurR-regulated permease PerM